MIVNHVQKILNLMKKIKNVPSLCPNGNYFDQNTDDVSQLIHII